MTTIKMFKYKLDHSDEYLLPKGAKLLSVGTQNEMPYMWALVDPTQDNEIRHIHIVGTGHELPTTCVSFIGTFMLAKGALVFHVFEEV